MRDLLARLIFVLLTTTTMVFFSEKVYWYLAGYELVGLVLYYAFPVFATLWAVAHFQVGDLAGLILVGALFAFLVEGVLTPVMYEAGLLDPIMPAYFIGWHGLLSVVFGWYWLRKWLVAGNWRRLLGAGMLFGLFWGFWALTFWLPENIAEFQQLAAAGEPVIAGIWSPLAYAQHAFIFTAALIAAHWLLGRGGWQVDFRPGKVEKISLLLVLLFFFGTLVVPVQPLAFLKLFPLLGVVFMALRARRRQNEAGPLLTDLSGPVAFRHTLALLTMPLTATLVYAGATAVPPSEAALQAIMEITPLAQSLLGGGLFLWALTVSLWSGKKPVVMSPSKSI